MKKIVFVLALALSTPAFAADLPASNGTPIIDAANVLPPEREAALVKEMLAAEKITGHQIMVLTIPSLDGDDIAAYSFRAATHYAPGNKDADDGVLYTFSTGDKAMKIETGRGIQALITDADTSEIQAKNKYYFMKKDEAGRPKDRDYAGGVEAITRAIIKQITPPSPEQLAIAKRAESEAATRRIQRNQAISDFFFTAISWIAGLGGIGGTVAFFVIRKRRREEALAEAERKEAARLYEIEREKERRERQRQQAIADAAALVQREKERVEAARQKAIRDENERKRIAKAKKDREDMLAAMTPAVRQAFLQKEEDDEAARIAAEKERQRLAEIERQKEAARLAEQRRKQKIIDDAREAERAEERRKQKIIDDAREAERAAQRRREDEDRAERRRREDSSSSSSWGSSSSSSSSDSWSGGGGSFDGGGSSSSFD